MENIHTNVRVRSVNLTMERCRLFLDIFYDHHLECELNDSCEGIGIHPLRGGVGECDSGWGVWR